mmetsp:Transcript_3109/g.6736  ORF Transcript_3109/g.6736 Transcript_3109/m.6736 type:complete len:84 (+) Transcript_3109:872-1123(+)
MIAAGVGFIVDLSQGARRVSTDWNKEQRVCARGRGTGREKVVVGDQGRNSRTKGKRARKTMANAGRDLKLLLPRVVVFDLDGT